MVSTVTMFAPTGKVTQVKSQLGQLKKRHQNEECRRLAEYQRTAKEIREFERQVEENKQENLQRIMKESRNRKFFEKAAAGSRAAQLGGRIERMQKKEKQAVERLKATQQARQEAEDHYRNQFVERVNLNVQGN